VSINSPNRIFFSSAYYYNNNNNNYYYYYYYYYYTCHGLECCHHTVAGALYKSTSKTVAQLNADVC